MAHSFYGIVAGFGDPITSDLPTLMELRFGSVRTDVQHLDPETVQRRMAEFQSTSIHPYYIITERHLSLFQWGEDIEFYNEPDLIMSPEAYADLWNIHVVPSLAFSTARIHAFSLSNLTRDRLSWLRRSWDRMIVKPKYVSVHRYPNEMGWWMPHWGFYSRTHEVRRLRAIIGSVPLTVSEFGYHTGSRKLLNVIPVRWTDSDVYTHVRAEWKFWRAQRNVERAFLYQFNDGPSSAWMDRYGVRRVDGTYKPSAFAHWGL